MVRESLVVWVIGTRETEIGSLVLYHLIIVVPLATGFADVAAVYVLVRDFYDGCRVFGNARACTTVAGRVAVFPALGALGALTVVHMLATHLATLVPTAVDVGVQVVRVS